MPAAPAPIAITTLVTRWGPLVLAAGEDGVHAISLLADPDDVAPGVRRRTGRSVVALREAPAQARRVVASAAEEITAYDADARAVWSFPILLDGLSAWDRRVLGAVRQIPPGMTASYGAVARMAGSPGAARAAGGAVSRNPIGLVVPCHRVIAGDGSIGGYGGTWPADRDALIALKRALLRHEGVEIAART